MHFLKMLSATNKRFGGEDMKETYLLFKNEWSVFDINIKKKWFHTSYPQNIQTGNLRNGLIKFISISIILQHIIIISYKPTEVP